MTSIGEVRTDAEGRAEPDLSALWSLPPLSRAWGRLGISAWAPGHRPDDASPVRVGEMESSAARTVERAVVLQRGSVLRGRVVGPDGTGSARATVTLRAPSTTVWGVCDEEGRFRLAIPERGAHRLVAVAAGVGAGATPPLDLDPTTDVDVGDVALVGPGVIEGIARYPDGQPVGEVAIEAWDVSLRDGDGAPVSEDPTPSPAGLVRTGTRTGPDGRFRLSGLRPGRFVVSHRLDAKATPDRVHETGTRDAVVVVSDRRVRFRVVDGAGQPVPGGGYLMRFNDGADIAAGDLGFDGTLDHWSRPGDRFAFAASVEGSAHAEVAATVPESPYETHHLLVLAPRAEATGRLRLRLTGTDGVPVSAALLELETPVARAIVQQKALRSASGEFVWTALPPGRHRLEVTPGREEHGPRLETYHPISEEVTILAGGETRLDLRARLGGRVRVTARSAAPAVRWRDVRLVAVPGGGEPLSMGTFVTILPGGYRTGSLEPDTPAVAWRLLEPGRYLLRLEGPGLRPAERTVDVEPGVVADVAMTLEPE